VLGASPSFPAVLPTVAAVGGTALRHSKSKRGFTEKVWGERSSGLGTGSGCSSTWPKPEWQTDSGCAGRTTNDVAAVGACATPVSVFDSTEGGWIDLCGTSVSSPLVAGIEAHASPSSRALPGGEAFYTTGALFDVKGGTNGRCTARYLCHGEVGYDGPTGNGTPDGPLP
jgi:subtilase family serine protease